MTLKQVFLLVAVAMIISIGNVRACKCTTANQEFGYAAKNSPLIFSGQLISVTEVAKSGATGAYLIRLFKFVPNNIWRGIKADTITLVSGNNNCDVMLENGVYIIYTNPTRDLISCNRIIKSSGIEAEIRRLDKVFTRKRFE